jgi:ABC-type branched-subunit amino acid transport system ATPase component
MTARIVAGNRLGGPGQSGNGSDTPVAMAAASRSFGTVRVLDRLTLDIVPGDLVALLGYRVAGKPQHYEPWQASSSPTQGR